LVMKTGHYLVLSGGENREIEDGHGKSRFWPRIRKNCPRSDDMTVRKIGKLLSLGEKKNGIEKRPSIAGLRRDFSWKPVVKDPTAFPRREKTNDCKKKEGSFPRKKKKKKGGAQKVKGGGSLAMKNE